MAKWTKRGALSKVAGQARETHDRTVVLPKRKRCSHTNLHAVLDIDSEIERFGNPKNESASLNVGIRDECLIETLFGTLGDARKMLEEWQEDYNWRRPHSVLANMTSMEFLERRTMDKMAA